MKFEEQITSVSRYVAFFVALIATFAAKTMLIGVPVGIGAGLLCRFLLKWWLNWLYPGFIQKS